MTSGIDYDALRGQTGGEPPDGIWQAYLVRAAIVDTRRGPALVTEWQSSGESAFYWTTWFGFDAGRMVYTQEFLDSIGVNRQAITDDAALEDELGQCIGSVYTVRTEAGAAWVNTYVEDAAAGSQTTLDDVPIDTAGLGATAEPVEAEPVASSTSSPAVGDPAPGEPEIPF